MDLTTGKIPRRRKRQIDQASHPLIYERDRDARIGCVDC
jgi:hypothetical protein